MEGPSHDHQHQHQHTKSWRWSCPCTGVAPGEPSAARSTLQAGSPEAAETGY